MTNEEFKESGIRNSITNLNLKAKLDQLNEKVKPILARTVNTLINFTDHSLDHSLGVENTYDILLDGNFGILNDNEKYLLITATLLHDIGMVGQLDDINIVDYQKIRRDGHNSFSKDRIIRESTLLGIDFNDAKLIADIAEAHRKVPLDSLNEEVAYNLGGVIKLRLLAAMLRFGDELHITKGRTSPLLMDILEPDSESLKHHKRHENVHGVSRSSAHRNIILISANADDWEMESLMHEMIGEIRNKHIEVKEVFFNNGITIDDIKLDLHCEDLITKEIFLALADHPMTETELNEKLVSRNSILINKILITYRLRNLFEIDTQTGKYCLTPTEDTLRRVFNSLINTQCIYEFIKSSYLSEVIGKVFDDITYRIYGFHIFNGDKEDRLLLIRNSPTVLDHFLNKQDMDSNFAQLDRSAVLDLLILNGYMQDVVKNPSLSTDEEVIFAMQNLNASLFKGLGSLLQFVQHLTPEKLEESRKVLEQQIEKKN